jgi:Uma2 family endonuclease
MLQRMTIEDLDALPDDGFHYELQGGMLVSEPLSGWRHGRVAFRVAELIGAHVRQHRLGVAVTNDSGFALSRSPDTLRGPDVAFVRRERLKLLGEPAKAFPGAPDLAIEVLSPSNTRSGLHAKVGDYLAAGSVCVWIVDPESRTVIEHRTLLHPVEFREGQTLEAQDLLPGFRIDVAELFED